MMGLHDLLPLLQGWQYKILDFDADDNLAASPVLAPGQRHKLIEVRDQKGWLSSVTVGTTSLYAKVIIETGIEELKFDTSAYFLVAGGYLTPGPVGFFCPRFGKTMVAGRKTVAATGTPETVGSTSLAPGAELTIRALPSNTGNVYIAVSSAGALLAANRFPLGPGESIALKVQKLDRVWLAVDVANEGVAFIYDSPDTVNSDTIFTVSFQPSYVIPFNQSSTVSVENPREFPKAVGGLNTTNISILSYQIIYIVVANEREFVTSLRALGDKTLAEAFAR